MANSLPVDRPKTVKWGRHRIRLMPGWGAAFRHNSLNRPGVDQDDVRARRHEGRGPGTLASVRMPSQHAGSLLDAGDDPVSLAGVPVIYGVDRGGVDTAIDAARHVAAAALAATLHEALEWVTVDGRRLADPHPSIGHGEGEDQWTWMLDRMLDVLDEYEAKWPASDPGAEG